LPKTSFRLHLAMNTLVVGWTLPAVRARWGLTPVRIRSCWANNEKKSIHSEYSFLPGDPPGARTQDPILKRDVLYLLS